MTQATKSQVTLKGSAQMVAEFFNYGINSILYQRGIYPPGKDLKKITCKNDGFENKKNFSESFTRKQEYGLTILVSSDDKVKHFLDSVLSQIKVIHFFIFRRQLFENSRKFSGLARSKKSSQIGSGFGKC